MPPEGYLTLIIMAISLYAIWPKKKPGRVVRPASARPAPRSGPPSRSRPPMPLPVMLTILFTQTAADIKRAWSESRAAASEVWRERSKPRHMSSAVVVAPVVVQKPVVVSAGTGTEGESEPGTDTEIRFSKGQLAAIQKWKRGEPLVKSDIAALLRMRKEQALVLIDSVKVEEPEERVGIKAAL